MCPHNQTYCSMSDYNKYFSCVISMDCRPWKTIPTGNAIAITSLYPSPFIYYRDYKKPDNCFFKIYLSSSMWHQVTLVFIVYKGSLQSNNKTKNPMKMGKRLKSTLHKRRHTNDQ